MVKKGGRGRAGKKVSETTAESDSDYHHHLDSTGDDSGSTRHEPLTKIPIHKLTESRVYETRSRRSLLAQCTLRASPGLRSPVRNVKGIASPSSTLAPPKTDLLETTLASQNFNLVDPPESQVRMSEGSISRSNQDESSKTSNLPPTSADFEKLEEYTTKKLGTLQESTPIVPPSVVAHGVAPELLLLPANRASRFNENQTEGSCVNDNGHNRCLARSSSLNCTQIVEMLEDSADEVDSAVDPALVTVQGYRVKKEVAPLLKTILQKYGDIAEHISFQSEKSISVHLEMMCDIYLNLEKIRLKDLASAVKGILAEVADLEAAKLKVGWLRKRIEDICEALEESKSYKAWKDEGERKNIEEKRLVKELEDSRERIRQQEYEAEESRKKTQQLDSEVEKSRKKSRLLEIEVAARQAEKKKCEEAIANLKAKVELLKRPLVDGLL